MPELPIALLICFKGAFLFAFSFVVDIIRKNNMEKEPKNTEESLEGESGQSKERPKGPVGEHVEKMEKSPESIKDYVEEIESQYAGLEEDTYSMDSLGDRTEELESAYMGASGREKESEESSHDYSAELDFLREKVKKLENEHDTAPKFAGEKSSEGSLLRTSKEIEEEILETEERIRRIEKMRQPEKKESVSEEDETKEEEFPEEEMDPPYSVDSLGDRVEELEGAYAGASGREEESFDEATEEGKFKGPVGEYVEKGKLVGDEGAEKKEESETKEDVAEKLMDINARMDSARREYARAAAKNKKLKRKGFDSEEQQRAEEESRENYIALMGEKRSLLLNALEGAYSDKEDAVKSKEEISSLEDLIKRTVHMESIKLNDEKTDAMFKENEGERYKEAIDKVRKTVEWYQSLKLRYKLAAGGALFLLGAGATAMGGGAGAGLATAVASMSLCKSSLFGAGVGLTTEGYLKRRQEKKEEKEVLNEFTADSFVEKLKTGDTEKIDEKLFALERGKNKKKLTRYIAATAAGVGVTLLLPRVSSYLFGAATAGGGEEAISSFNEVEGVEGISSEGGMDSGDFSPEAEDVSPDIETEQPEEFSAETEDASPEEDIEKDTEGEPSVEERIEGWTDHGLEQVGSWEEYDDGYILDTGKEKYKITEENYQELRRRMGGYVRYYITSSIEEGRSPEMIAKLLNQRFESWLPIYIEEGVKGTETITKGLFERVSEDVADSVEDSGDAFQESPYSEEVRMGKDMSDLDPTLSGEGEDVAHQPEEALQEESSIRELGDGAFEMEGGQMQGEVQFEYDGEGNPTKYARNVSLQGTTGRELFTETGQREAVSKATQEGKPIGFVTRQLRNVGRTLFMDVNLYNELQEAGHNKEADFVKEYIKNVTERIENTYGEGVIDYSKLPEGIKR